MHSLLQDYMPLPPEDCLLRSDSIVSPEFEFTKVECLLFAFHTVSKQVRYSNMKTKVHTQDPHVPASSIPAPGPAKAKAFPVINHHLGLLGPSKF